MNVQEEHQIVAKVRHTDQDRREKEQTEAVFAQAGECKDGNQNRDNWEGQDPDELPSEQFLVLFAANVIRC